MDHHNETTRQFTDSLHDVRRACASFNLSDNSRTHHRRIRISPGFLLLARQLRSQNQPRPANRRTCRTRLTSNSASSLKFSRAPVTPARDTAYTKPLASFSNHLQTRVGRRRRHQKNQVEIICLQRAANSSDSSGVRSVTRMPSIPASLCVADEFIHPVLQQRIEVTEKNDGDIRSPPRFCGRFQNRLQAEAMLQCALRSALNHRAIGHRIAERHAEFNDGGAGICQFD